MKNLNWLFAVVLIPFLFSGCQEDILDQAEMPDTYIDDSNSSRTTKDIPIEYDGSPTINAFYAGQDIEIGSVIVGNLGVSLYVTINILDPWYITNTKIWVGTDIENLPVNKAGNPQRGKFPVNEDLNPAVQTVTYEFPLAELGVVIGSVVFVATHANVQMEYWELDKLMIREESAWGFGEPIGGKAWGWYSNHIIQAPAL